MGRLTQFTCLPQAISTNGRIPILINGGDGDRSNEGLGAVEIGVAFGQDVDRGKIVFAQQVSQPAEPQAEHKRFWHISCSLQNCA